ncbi:MAG: radical SAM protein, partial [Clostridiales bacterium]|nr:radical SAM protein [Clostridiales bacterium]
MIPSRNNITVKTGNTDKPEYAVMNPVSGSFDLLTEEEYGLLLMLENGGPVPAEFSSFLLERGYAFDSVTARDAASEKAYSDFTQEASNSPVRLLLVPTYGCNLSCTPCYQPGVDGGQGHASHLITRDAVDAFFNYADKMFVNNPSIRKEQPKPFITLIGGEPFINSPAQRTIINYIISKCVTLDFELSAVTNGYDFKEYIDMLKKARIKDIRFTLDGTKGFHDFRRGNSRNAGSFDRIIEGIDAAIGLRMPVKLHLIVDMDNMEDLVSLAEFIDEKGWLELPKDMFEAIPGRNLDILDCYAKPHDNMAQAELWSRFASSSRKHPILAKLYRPDFKGVRHIAETGGMGKPSFDVCPACKTEWVFDLYGNIYGCMAACGREEFLLGRYWPEVRHNMEAISTWKSRNVKSIASCSSCGVAAICGGGCGVAAALKSNGNVLSPDCQPVRELLEEGIKHYSGEIKGFEIKSVSENVPATASVSIKQQPVHSGLIQNANRKTQGCLICGHELIYSGEAPTSQKCYICGTSKEASIFCPNGHYICDGCHSLDIPGKVEQLLVSSSEPDPVVLAQMLFELPGLNMHGPEYHSIVPAVLVTAYQNLRGERDSDRIKEAFRRGKDTKGGSCGLNGNCGSGVGAGIAASIIEGATP